MNLLVINPNTTSSMTAKIAAAANSVANDSTNIIAVQPDCGPVSIEGYYDEAFAVPGVISEIQNNANTESCADAIIIACFDDTGLNAARCIAEVPVVGIGEAGFHMASMVCNKFGVITTLARSIAALQHNLYQYGLLNRCAKVRAAEVAVLELEDEKSDARARINNEIKLSITEDHSDAIVLGCAGMADLASQLQTEHQVPVIDGVTAAVKICEGLYQLGITTSKIGAYAKPRAKSYIGAMKNWAPK